MLCVFCLGQWSSRLFQPVQYGQKPEGRTVAFPSTHPPRMANANASTATPQGQVRGRPSIATFSANPDTKAAAAPFQNSQASVGAPRHQPTSTSSTAAGPAHPSKLRAQTAVQASTPGPPLPPPQAPSLVAGQSAPPQRLVLTSQAQARLPSKWPYCPGSALTALEQCVRNTGCLKSLCCPLPLSVPQSRPGA